MKRNRCSETREYNNSVSVDCVVFGFDGTDLCVLLESISSEESKLPGSLIYDDEDLEAAAYRVLEEITGLSNLYLQQLKVFSEPDRISGADLEWVNLNYNIKSTRIITVAYYALVKLNDRIKLHAKRRGVKWRSVDTIKRLSLDHKDIIVSALDRVAADFGNSPIAFELLPKKFTIRQLQNLHEAILGVAIDSRNFRKKLMMLNYLVKTEEKEIGVAHKPASLYYFDRSIYNKELKNIRKLSKSIG